MKTKNRQYLEKAIGISIFSALAFVIACICQIIPPIAGFLSLDAKDAVISIAAFVYGPVSGVIIAFIAAFIEFATISTTFWYGFVMNFASSATFAFTSSIIYKYRRTYNGALVSYFCAIVATTGVMLVLNRLVTPIYLVYIGMEMEAATKMVIGMLTTVLLPFNFAKALMNSAVAMILYKPIALALRRTNLIRGKGMGTKFGKQSIITVIIGTVALVTSVVILIIVNS